MFYADTSALVKLVVVEAESGALRDWIVRGAVELASSDLARTELVRAVRRCAPEALGQARDVLSRLLLVRAPSQLFDDAGRLDPVELRSLDAVHVATALALADDLEGVVTYDDRMADAVRALGLPVIAPS
jgi:predicted nucleic acid-binding protein